MLINLPDHHYPNLIRNLNSQSLYYYYQSNPILGLEENFYYYHHHLGPEAIFRSDSIEYFQQGPYSQIPLTYIFKTSSRQTKNPNLIKWLLKYASKDLIDNLLNQNRLELEVIFNLENIAQLIKLQSDYLTKLGLFYINGDQVKVEYVYLDYQERQRFAQLGHQYLIEQISESKMMIDSSRVIKTIWDQEFQKSLIREKYQNFWLYYLIKNKDQITNNNRFLTKSNLEKMLQFFLEVSLSEPLIFLDEFLSQNHYSKSNWETIKSSFRMSKMNSDHQMSNLFKFLFQFLENDRSEIVKRYFGDLGFWINGLKHLNKESFQNLDSKDFFWIIQNQYISNSETERQLLLVLLLASVEGYQYQTFLDFYYYALNRNVSSDKIKKIIRRYYQQSNQKRSEFEKKVIDFLDN